MKRNVLYIFAGASGCGKTTLIQRIIYFEKLCGSVNKYTTRETRPTEKIGETVVQDDTRQMSLGEMEKRCDVMYEANDYKYGFISEEVNKALEKQDIAIILSDIRAITILKEKINDAGFGVRVIYISSKMDSTKEFIKTWQKRFEDSLKDDILNKNKSENEQKKFIQDTNISLREEVNSFNEWMQNAPSMRVPIREVVDHCESVQNILPQSATNRLRAEKQRLMYTRYVHNIHLFDHVILNFSTIDDMVRQAKNIILSKEVKSRKSGPVVFIICAAPKSGKGTLMENLNIMGTSQIQITTKYAGRTADPEHDKRDGMIAKGKTWFENRFNDSNTEPRWEWTFHAQGTKYAVLLEDIKTGLCKGISQIFASNFKQLERLQRDKKLQKTLSDVKGRFVFIYLHRVRTEEEIKEQIPDEAKRKDIQKVYRSYIKNIDKVDHVIINPSYLTFREDLHDQMMTLIEIYSGKRIR